MDSTLIYMAAFIALCAVAVATAILAVRRNGRDVGLLLNQLLVFVGIAALLPLASWAGATLLHPRTTLTDLQSERQRIQNSQNYQEQDKDTRAKTAAELQEIQKKMDEETRLFYRAMFWVAFPIGVVTLIVGMFIRIVAVGTGLAFGGLCTLTSGCYSYWDGMGDGLRFWSLLMVLVTFVVIGLSKFKAPPRTVIG